MEDEKAGSVHLLFFLGIILEKGRSYTHESCGGSCLIFWIAFLFSISDQCKAGFGNFGRNVAHLEHAKHLGIKQQNGTSMGRDRTDMSEECRPGSMGG
jgi:hypothetical protein